MTKTTTPIFKENCRLSVNGSLWIECDGERFFGPGPLELLERIQASGSISRAAQEMNLSYKKAWTIISRLNTAARTPMVQTFPGGKEGGGSIVSDEARLLIRKYRQMREAFSVFLKAETDIFNRT